MNLNDYLTQAHQAEQNLEWPQAVEWYKKVLTVTPEHQTALEQLAWCLSRAKEYQQSLQVLQDLAKHQPQVAKWPYMIGYQYHEQEQWTDAIKWYNRSLALHPDYIVVLYRKGYAHFKLKQIGEALRAFEHCRTLWHALPEGPAKQRDKSNCAKAAYHQAEILLENQSQLSYEASQAAIPLLNEAIQLDPADHNKHYLLGKAYVELGRPEMALTSFQQANQLKPDQDYILDRWAIALARLERLNEAWALYERIPPWQRKSYILRNLGLLYFRLKKYDLALTTLQQAVQKDGRNHYGHYYLGLSYRETGQLGLAVREFREAVRLKQKIYEKSFNEAQQALDDLLAQHPEATTVLVGSRQRGVVIRFSNDKGFGFIKRETGGEIFFHITDCRKGEDIEQGVQVEFEEGNSEKGPKAIRVNRVHSTGRS